MSDTKIVAYGYTNAERTWNNEFLLRPIIEELSARDDVRRIFEIGCGNGVTASQLASKHYDVTGIDPSFSGIQAHAGPYTVSAHP